MPRKRQPVAVLRATGSRHYSKSQLEERENQEVKVPMRKEVSPPSYLSPQLAEKFRMLAPTLTELGILTFLDADALARYLIAEQNYLRATKRLTGAINSGNTAEADRWASMQDRFFRQCRAAGSDLGLTVSGRCGLEVPAAPKPPSEGEEEDLFGAD